MAKKISDIEDVAILLPVYNGERYLSSQLDSIFNQTYKNIVLYILDDYSGDSSTTIIKSYMKRYKNIKFSQNRSNKGVVKSFEILLNQAQENYIMFCDQDDIWIKDKIKIQIDHILKHDQRSALLVHSDLSMIDQNAAPIQQSYFKYKNYNLSDHKDLAHIITRCGVMGNTILINKTLKDMVLPFPVDIPMHDFWIALVAETKGKRITIKKPLVNYRIHSSNTSNKKENFDTIYKLRRFLKLGFGLPYIEKKSAIEAILKYDLKKDDKIVLDIVYQYLLGSNYTLSLLLKLYKYKLIKPSLSFIFFFLINYLVNYIKNKK